MASLLDLRLAVLAFLLFECDFELRVLLVLKLVLGCMVLMLLDDGRLH